MVVETRQQRRARERRESAQRQVAGGSQGGGDAKPPESLIRGWLTALGLPAALYGAGLCVLAFHFWLGFWIACLGAAWLLGDWLYVSRKESWRVRALISLVPLALGGLVLWLAFRPADLEISAVALDGNYAKDTMIAGIKWDSKYSDLRVTLQNSQNDPYANIDVTIRTDLSIAKAGSMNSLSQCQFNLDMPGIGLSGATLSIIDKQGRAVDSTPLFTPESEHVTATQYKIFCDKILPGEHLEFVIAVSPGLNLVGRKKPSWASVEVNYDAYGRTHNKTMQYCFEPACSSLPPQGS